MACFQKWSNWFYPLLIACCLVFGFQISRDKVVGEEHRAYMIPGRVFQRMLAGRAGTKSFRQDRNQLWMADVDESQWEYIIIHHSATESGNVESIHQEHLKRRDANGFHWLGIGYHFVIGNGHGMPDGSVQSTFRWKEQIHGAHSGNELFNTRGIGICLIGNFEEGPPTKSQLESLKRLIKVLSDRHRVTPENLMGHSAIKATACPGKHFRLDEVRQVISNANR